MWYLLNIVNETGGMRTNLQVEFQMERQGLH